ncbi:MAG: DUF485 domain-containing protein, partial [Kutzneria sp.]|nr:DUF485 domain-containing protein [Kutzneria sp.]
MAIQASPQFVALRRRHRRVTFLTLTAFSCWFMAYVLFVDYAPGIMTIQLLGKINVGLVLGIVQIVGVLT